MSQERFEAVNCSFENHGFPVWEVRGPKFTRLITVPRDSVAVSAKQLASDLNKVYRMGLEDGKKEQTK